MSTFTVKRCSVTIMAINSAKHVKNNSRILYIFFSVLISVGFFFYFFSTVSFKEVIAVVRGVSAAYVIVFLFFSFAMSLCRTWRYSLIMEASGYRIFTFALFLVTLARNFFSDLLPARLGTLVYIYLVQNRLGLPFGVAAASFGLSFIFDILTLGFLILLAALMISSKLIPPLMIITGGVIIVVVSGSVLFCLPVILNILGRICLTLLPIGEKYRLKFHGAMADTRRDVEAARRQGIYWKIFFLSLGVRCYKYLSLYALLLALVIPLGFTTQSFPLAKVFLGLCSAELAASLPISGIAGFGAYEGAWSLVFQMFGYSEQIAFLTSISHHLITQVYGYLLGVLALLLLLHPYFQGCFIKISDQGSLADRKVWVQIAGIGLLLLGSLYFLFPVQVGGDRGKESTLNGNYAVGEKEPVVPENISGKFVYQWNKGIYIGILGTSTSRRLVARGTYPRWSPDGRSIAYVDKNKIMLIPEKGGEAKVIATADRAKALCFSPDGSSIFFTDGTALRRVVIKDHTVKTLLDGYELLEIDVAGDPFRLAATVRTSFGYKVQVFDLKSGENRTVASGCSASLSPDGRLVTVNGKNHRILHLYHWDTLKSAGNINAPVREKFDNQFWSNSPDWLVSVSEGSRDLFIHHVSENRSYRVTWTGGCDRADLFVNGTKY